MSEQIRIYCAEPGDFHGRVTPRKQWIDTFQRTESSWETAPPSRAKAKPESKGEILHRTSEVALTTEGEALAYAFKYSPTTGRRWGRSPRMPVHGRDIVRVAIDLQTGAEYEADQGQDYQIDHVTYEMRCRCGKAFAVRRERLHWILDQLAHNHLGDEVALSDLEQIVQMRS